VKPSNPARLIYARRIEQMLDVFSLDALAREGATDLGGMLRVDVVRDGTIPFIDLDPESDLVLIAPRWTAVRVIDLICVD
jgi:hypothetical protein